MLSGQVDAIAGVPPAQFQSIADTPGFEAIDSPSGTHLVQYMFTSGPNAGDFADPAVREALRLLVDRQQIVDNVFYGYARVGNDLSGIDDATTYPADVPQREYDPEAAAKILADAGYDDLEVTLYTSDIYPGIRDMSTLMAEQAAAGGVTINLEVLPSDQYWSESYLQNPFGSSYWSGQPLFYYYGANYAMAVGTGENETEWDDPEWRALYDEALSTTDRDAADQLLMEAQRILYERGGYIIPVYPDFLDGARSTVHGFGASSSFPLGDFDFVDVYVTH